MSAVPPLLHYALTTDPDPPQASPKSGNPRKLSLTFVVSPPDYGAVFCDRITFHFDVGPTGSANATYLTSVGDAILTIPPNPPGEGQSEWDLDESVSGNGTFSFVRSTDDKKVAGQGYAFTIYGIYVSPVVGTATIKVTEHSSQDGTNFQTRQANFDVPKFPTMFGSVVFQTDKTSVNPGNTGATLRWQGDDTATYALSRNGVPVKGPVRSPRPTGPLTEDTVFTLTVGYSAGGVAVERDYYVTILVRNPVVSLMGPNDPVRTGAPVTLKWHTEGVEHCFIEGPGLPRKNVDRLDELVVRPQRAGDLEYRLRGTTALGDTVESEFTVRVLPKAPKADAQLVLVKTSGNKDGHVAIRVADGASRFQKGPADLATGWAEADGASGTLQIVNDQRKSPPVPDLLLIKTRNTKQGRVEVHVCTYPQHGQGDDLSLLAASFLESRAANGTWLMAPMGDVNWDPPPHDLVWVQTVMTTGVVGVMHSTSYRGFAGAIGPWITAYPAADASKGTWLLADMDGDGLPPDLVFVQTAGTKSGRVELSYATGRSRYKEFGPRTVTGFSTRQAANGSWHLADMTGDGKPDLVFVKTAKTASKQVEIYWADAAQGYKKLVGGFTRFAVAQGPTGTWCVLGVGSPHFPAGTAVLQAASRSGPG